MFNFELEDGAQQEILNLDSTRIILLIFAGKNQTLNQIFFNKISEQANRPFK